jgi:hypothetical protein
VTAKEPAGVEAPALAIIKEDFMMLAMLSEY